MPLQNLFLILLLPIVFYEILTACFKQVSYTRRIAYKTMTWFSFFVLFQLILVIYENTVVSNVVHFPIWALLFLFYGPCINLIVSTWHNNEQQVRYNKYLGDFYSMMCVFICGLFIIFMKADLPYIFEAIGGILVLSFVYYGVTIGKKITNLSKDKEPRHTKNKEMGRWIHLCLSLVLVLLFFGISRDIKSSGLLFLLLFYVSLAFLRKNVEEKIAINRYEGADQNREDQDNDDQEEWEREEEDLMEQSEFNQPKYGQTKLNEIVLQRCNIKVQDIIIENKAFLDANFKMTDLASQTKISRYYLAQYFNVVHRMNFREYINKLRIDHVVQYINESNKKDKLSVNDLFVESAFNSKTSFFKSFKHVLGCTPFEYLKKCQD